jgi:putative MFS transporter
MFAVLATLFVLCGIAVQFPRETVGRPMVEEV